MKKINLNFLLLLSIIAAALFLRLYNLSHIPVGFNDDEAAFGYNAYSILKTGKDEWGKVMPFPAFESFGDWKLVFYLYSVVPSIAVFGLSNFAVRLPSALFGVLAVYATYLLTKQITKSGPIALIAALLLAISPWHVVASRNAFESDVAVPFITLGTYFFLKSLKDQRFSVPALGFFIICFYIYRSNWLFVPIYLASLLFLFRKSIKNPLRHLKMLTISLIFLLPLLPVVISFKGQSRFIQESFIWGPPKIGIINDINEKRGVCSQVLPANICVVFYNKYLAFLKQYTNNYLDNLSPKTFFDKIQPTGFQSFATRSPLYFFELPLVFLGVFWILKRNKIASLVLIPWLLVVPLGASAVGIGNYGRINIFMPAIQILTAFGIFSVISTAKKFKIGKPTTAFLSLIIILSVFQMLLDLFYQEPFKISRYQRFGYESLFSYLKSKEQNYDNILVSRKIDDSHQYIQYVFSQKLDPLYFQKNNVHTLQNAGWLYIRQIGKYSFPTSINTNEIPPASLVVVSEKELETEIQPIESIKDVRGDTIFQIYEGDKIKE